MNVSINDCTINVATVNGSGSQSSNNILIKSLFRMGIPVGGKNLFPSNIAGLPTWFSIRINKDGFIARKPEIDITVAMNPATIQKDINELKKNGVFIYNEDIKFDPALLRNDTLNIGIPFKKLVSKATDSIKLKKLLTNMVYVGVLAELLNIDEETLDKAIEDLFEGKKESVIEMNKNAVSVGKNYVRENINEVFPYKVQKMGLNNRKILIDGNTASALGMIYGGCTFVSWYPITPSSSLAESYISFAEELRKDKEGKNNFAVVQAEDEISAIGMVLGASWTGARAATATSGPGISLMSEFSGYSYFAEIPAVIWNIQRVGPSTGLPTRTMQGDILSVAHLSHGDTQQIMLFPSTPNECFDFGRKCFDYADRLQTPIFIMSDLDLGMNNWICNEFENPKEPFDRGKVLKKEDLDKLDVFYRYDDKDKDGICYRTLPGTEHPLAAYFTRGSGHNEKGQYTESNEDYVRVIDRIKRKFDTARSLLPQPLLKGSGKQDKGIIAFGSTDYIMDEFLNGAKNEFDYLRIRSFPFSEKIEEFINSHKVVYVVEQNRDAQMTQLLASEYPKLASKLVPILHYDGLPICAEYVRKKILEV